MLISVNVKIQKTALCRETDELRTLYTKLTLHQNTNRKCTLETEFKTRYSNHVTIFIRKQKNSTELSKYVWNLKKKDIDYKINWSILKHTKSYSNASKICQLCRRGRRVVALVARATTFLF